MGGGAGGKSEMCGMGKEVLSSEFYVKNSELEADDKRGASPLISALSP